VLFAQKKTAYLFPGQPGRRTGPVAFRPCLSTGLAFKKLFLTHLTYNFKNDQSNKGMQNVSCGSQHHNWEVENEGIHKEKHGGSVLQRCAAGN
jgi:hypothetical protein